MKEEKAGLINHIEKVNKILERVKLSQPLKVSEPSVIVVSLGISIHSMIRSIRNTLETHFLCLIEVFLYTSNCSQIFTI